MSENMIIVGCSEMCEGKLEELKAAMNGLVELVKATLGWDAHRSNA